MACVRITTSICTVCVFNLPGRYVTIVSRVSKDINDWFENLGTICLNLAIADFRLS